MTEKEVRKAIDKLRKQGWTDDDILKSFYVMYQEGKIVLDELRGLCKVIGYEFTDEFEQMSEADKKTKGLKPKEATEGEIDFDEEVTRETFANGRVLKYMIRQAKREENSDNLYNVFFALRHTMLYIPFSAQLEPVDVAKFLNAKKDDTIQSEGNVKMVPEFVESRDGKFLPVFSDRRDLEKYFEHASVVEEDILGVIEIFKHMKGIIAICVDPFDNPFVVDPKAFSFIEQIPLAFDD